GPVFLRTFRSAHPYSRESDACPISASWDPWGECVAVLRIAAHGRLQREACGVAEAPGGFPPWARRQFLGTGLAGVATVIMTARSILIDESRPLVPRGRLQAGEA